MTEQVKSTVIPHTQVTNCLYCNKPFRGRSDKKFCNDYCRNYYNNNKSLSNTPYMRQVNAILRKNRNIMYSLLTPNTIEIVVTHHTLLSAGFDFSYCTQIQDIAIGRVYYCYDFYYVSVTENDMVIQRYIQ